MTNTQPQEIFQNLSIKPLNVDRSNFNCFKFVQREVNYLSVQASKSLIVIW